MNNLVKSLGAIIVLLGVLFMVIYYVGPKTNVLLGLGGITMAIGIITHIVVNKKVKD